VRPRLAGGAQQVDQRRGQGETDGTQADADRDREPDPVDAQGASASQVAGPGLPGDGSRGAVGEEDAQEDGV